MQHSYNKRNRGRQAKTYTNQLLQNTGCDYEELSNIMTHKKQWNNCDKTMPSKLEIYIGKYWDSGAHVANKRCSSSLLS